MKNDVANLNSILVTGSAGFIGNAVVRRLLAQTPDSRVVSLDALTYAGHEANLTDLPHAERHTLVRGDISDDSHVRGVFQKYRPSAIINVAAETHVDQSNVDARPFARTNVLGTQVLLEHARSAGIPLVHVSTDEVYGSLPAPEKAVPSTPLNPTNPYAASKAAGDLMALSAFKTHGQDVRITRCTNNFGPRQTPEKLIPLMTLRAMAGETLPVYGDGLQVRDWIHVDDHAAGIIAALFAGRAGQVYHFTADEPRNNLDVVGAIIKHTGAKQSQIVHVEDRPAHDRRYAIEDDATRSELDWSPHIGFDQGLAETVAWYKTNTEWCQLVGCDDPPKLLKRNCASG